MKWCLHGPKKIVVFIGPSLPLAEAREILDADYHPPIARGDITALLNDPPDIIGIIDGVFHQQTCSFSQGNNSSSQRRYNDCGSILYGCSQSCRTGLTGQWLELEQYIIIIGMELLNLMMMWP